MQHMKIWYFYIYFHYELWSLALTDQTVTRNENDSFSADDNGRKEGVSY